MNNSLHPEIPKYKHKFFVYACGLQCMEHFDEV